MSFFSCDVAISDERRGGINLKDEDSSIEVKGITIMVVSEKISDSNHIEFKNVDLSTNFSDEETVRIIKECLISLEREASQSCTN